MQLGSEAGINSGSTEIAGRLKGAIYNWPGYVQNSTPSNSQTLVIYTGRTQPCYKQKQDTGKREIREAVFICTNSEFCFWIFLVPKTYWRESLCILTLMKWVLIRSMDECIKQLYLYFCKTPYAIVSMWESIWPCASTSYILILSSLAAVKINLYAMITLYLLISWKFWGCGFILISSYYFGLYS